MIITVHFTETCEGTITFDSDDVPGFDELTSDTPHDALRAHFDAATGGQRDVLLEHAEEIRVEQVPGLTWHGTVVDWDSPRLATRRCSAGQVRPGERLVYDDGTVSEPVAELGQGADPDDVVLILIDDDRAVFDTSAQVEATDSEAD